MVSLDFTLNTAEERKEYVDHIIRENKYANSDLETMANYILYGKNEEGQSVVDKKEVQIKTKYNSYSKKEPESLDELLESPTFDEQIFSSDNHYKSIKPRIDREKDYDIPNISELWRAIDRYQYIIDVNLGKIEDSSIPRLTNLQLYKFRHMLIDLRRQQFYLKDITKPTICMYGTNVHHTYTREDQSIPWDFTGSDFSIAPLGVLIGNDPKFYSPRQYTGPDYVYNSDATYIIDFRNYEHIYYLLENYEDLKISSQDKPESTVGFILDTLDFYVARARLSEVKQVILEYKKAKVHNEVIREKLERDFGLSHSVNYISTIWKQKICKEIAEAARLHYDYFLNRNKPFAWKRCTQCGQIKLKDTREFMRKSKSSDGLAGKCKECNKINRLKNKQG